ncbi:MAG TPA: hypothetical protein VLM89_06885 [Phycisphaerae bacterium]|nr:hypothetical protein [Phycisphaerae bacterium]
MAETATEREPQVQGIGQNDENSTDIDELMNSLNSVANELAGGPRSSAAPVGESSVETLEPVPAGNTADVLDPAGALSPAEEQEATVADEAEAAVTSSAELSAGEEASGPVTKEPVAEKETASGEAPAGGIDRTLDDLDALLADVGEPSSKENGPQEASDVAAVESTEAAAVQEKTSGARTEDSSATAAEAGGASEAAPSDSAAQATEPAVETASERGAEPSGNTVGASIRSGCRTPAGGLARALSNMPIVVLKVIDVPFACLGPDIKNLAGYAAVATLILAAAVWIAGPLLISR